VVSDCHHLLLVPLFFMPEAAVAVLPVELLLGWVAVAEVAQVPQLQQQRLGPPTLAAAAVAQEIRERVALAGLVLLFLAFHQEHIQEQLQALLLSPQAGAIPL
jgi:hypothetical protein